MVDQFSFNQMTACQFPVAAQYHFPFAPYALGSSLTNDSGIHSKMDDDKVLALESQTASAETKKATVRQEVVIRRMTLGEIGGINTTNCK